MTGALVGREYLDTDGYRGKTMEDTGEDCYLTSQGERSQMKPALLTP